MLGKKGDFGILRGHGPFPPPKSAYAIEEDNLHMKLLALHVDF